MPSWAPTTARAVMDADRGSPKAMVGIARLHPPENGECGSVAPSGFEPPLPPETAPIQPRSPAEHCAAAERLVAAAGSSADEQP